ncbi:hypothetical protein BBOV_III011405 [Babesia bovis T2Bo]|uniref:hypothetical protein n=1 Tax=Babesia bovis T2Bo TaxID=484906 RepID=UPI001C34CBD8|nr:hypothetical protein BBOV_III011405 [Babesia bovis T2Bo]KAG6440085.1 hypothetical protein BBOV_III011405 [Babesia bovis T2Bo]
MTFVISCLHSRTKNSTKHCGYYIPYRNQRFICLLSTLDTPGDVECTVRARDMWQGEESKRTFMSQGYLSVVYSIIIA